jgi:hypothetical protein
MDILLIAGCYLVSLLCIVSIILLYKKWSTKSWVKTFVLFLIGCMGTVMLFLPLNILDIKVGPQETAEQIDTVEMINRIKERIGYEESIQ